MQANTPVILVDFRENRSKVPEFLAQTGVCVETADLTADYAIGKDCLVERKTVVDFITSIADGRIFKQVAYLANTCRNPLVLLEGGGLYLSGRVSANIVRGTMLWICVTKKVALIRTANERDTACLLALLVKQRLATQMTNADSVRRKRQMLSPWQRQMNMLAQLPGIGRQMAKDILTVFGSVAKIAAVSDIELQSIPGIGKKRLSEIRKFFPLNSEISAQQE